MDIDALLEFDRAHLWHPYSSMSSMSSMSSINSMGTPNPVYPVVSAQGVRLKLADGRELIDGMASWWSAIHGYNHPDMNRALKAQIDQLSHVMFGGLTHPAAVELGRKLLELTPAPLQTIFYSDSGSVAVEVAMKMALQYWQSRGEAQRTQFLSLRGAYHGDTLGAMSICDPATGMHSLFADVLNPQHFVERPNCRFGEVCSEQDIAAFAAALQAHQNTLAAVVLEPIVQGAGGMWFYSADYLSKIRELCDQHNVLLIFDEIATGFGRTGRMFACEHADVSPDIMCIGKALTGGYLGLAATLTTKNISDSISQSKPGVFMHGPTFMGNPLACTAALASINLLLESDWRANIKAIETGLREGLSECAHRPQVADVRVLGAIGVVELKQPVDMRSITEQFVNAGVWVRPFGKLVYLMPPYVISHDDLDSLTSVIALVIHNMAK